MPIFNDRVGQIILLEDECFWIFPRSYIKSEEIIYSPWFSYFEEKWRLIKDEHYFTSPYGIQCWNLNFLLFRKIRSSLLKHKFTIQIKLAMEDGSKLENTGVIDSHYGCRLHFSHKFRYKIFSKNGFVKLFFNIQREEHSSSAIHIRNGDVQTAGDQKIENEQNIENEEGNEDEESSNDEGSSENETNSENEDIKKKKRNISKAKGVKKLAQNLKQVFLDEQATDTVLKVDNREFKVHRVILIARSPVFASMFQHDLAEKNSNSADIPDCTAESFEVFLHYLYTGSADTVSKNNVHNLYYAADKYQVDDLKKQCVKFMKNNLSVETFCDIIALSLRHGEKKLQNAATNFFCGNIKKILKTTQWQKYMAENPTQANELLIIAHGA